MIMSDMITSEVTERLIERLHSEVKEEIRRRSEITAEAANFDDPFQRPQRRNTSRGAIFNLASSGGGFASLF